MSDVRAHLRALAEALPAGAALPVPREWLLELLAPAEPTLAPRDLTVAELAARYGRGQSAVRAWLERGEFPGAYKLQGREWRAPAAAIAAFEERQAAGRPRQVGPAAPSAADLGAWRRSRSH